MYIEHKYKCKKCGEEYKRIASWSAFHGCPQCGSKRMKYLEKTLKGGN